MRTTHIKRQVTPNTNLFVWIPGACCQTHFRVDERACPMGRRQGVTKKDIKSITCHLLLEFTVKVGLLSPMLLTQEYLYQAGIPHTLCPVLGWDCDFITRKGKTRGKRIKRVIFLGVTSRSDISNWHCYCRSPGTQMAKGGTGSWKLIHGENALLGPLQLTASTSPSQILLGSQLDHVYSCLFFFFT